MPNGCCCCWTNCLEIQKELEQANHKLAGYAEVSNQSNNYPKFLSCVLDNFKQHNPNQIEKIKQLKNLRIAYHHYTDSGLDHINFNGKRKQWMKGLALKHRPDHGISTGESDKIFNFEDKGGWKTFIRPNQWLLELQ